MNKIKREPVLSAGAIAGAIGTLIALAVNLGWLNLTPEQVSSLNQALVPLVVLAMPIATAYLARRKVTPVSNPRMADGTPAELLPK
jgi:hypothetical protein